MSIHHPRDDYHTVIKKLGLTGNLKLCLDAGHEGSLAAAGTKWLDLSGNGYDFFLGTTAGAQSSDPTINGTAGRRSSGEYLSFDGNDQVRYDTTNETWMQNLHKDNARFTIAGWWYLASTGSQEFFAGNGGQTNLHGINFFTNSSGILRIGVGNGLGDPGAISAGTFSVANNRWNFSAVAMDDPAGGTASCLKLNDSVETFNGTYSSPSASNASFTYTIGSSGNNNRYIANGGRIANIAVWEGVALTPAQLHAIFQTTRGKFGV